MQRNMAAYLILMALGAIWQAPAAAFNTHFAQPDHPPSLLVRVQTPVDAMPPAMRVAFVRAIQEELADHGYAPGTADGVFGSRTRAAIRAYQGDASLPVDGVATKELLDHLKFVLPRVTAAAVAPAPQSLIANIQTELARRGYYRDEIDGLNGRLTGDAVRAFQTDAGLPVTGVLDQRLLAELHSTDADIRARESP